MTWRVGSKNPHTLYLGDQPIGFVLDPELALRMVERLECFPAITAQPATAAGPAPDGSLLMPAQRWDGEKERADVERLHRLLDERWRLYDTTLTSLAAANALLAEWYKNYAKQSNLSRRTKDRLAAQPATARTHCGEHAGWRSDCERCGDAQPATAPLSDDLGTALVQVCDAEHAQPATAPTGMVRAYVGGGEYEMVPATAPACTPELRPGCTQADYYEPTRTEADDSAEEYDRLNAEQRVLDANHELDTDWLKQCEFSRDMRIVNFARAELARRGLKP